MKHYQGKKYRLIINDKNIIILEIKKKREKKENFKARISISLFFSNFSACEIRFFIPDSKVELICSNIL